MKELSINKSDVLRLFIAFCLAFMMVIGFGKDAYAAKKISMNISSVTMVKGESYDLKVLSGDKLKKASSWTSSNSDVAEVSSTGKVTALARGSSYIRAKVSGKTVECLVSVVNKTDTDTVRYNVLIMDVSWSMRGSRLSYAKKAAKAFSKTVLDADGRNYISVVTLNSKPEVVCDFTDNISTVNKTIKKMKAGGSTNIEAALANAGTLLKHVPSGKKVIKNIVLLSDGMPKKGKTQASGRYKKTDSKDYKYANATYATDAKLKKKYFVYALGFFHDLSKKNLKFGTRFMKDLASEDKDHVINNEDELKKVMGDIAKVITTVTVNPSSLTLYVGESASVDLLVNGQKISGNWKSDDSKTASVSKSGTVTGKKAGKTKVTAAYKGKKYTCSVTVKNPTLIVAFDACGGKASFTDKKVTYQEKYGDLPTASRKGFNFLGWYTKSTDGTKVTKNTKVKNLIDHTLYACWEEKPHRYKVYHEGGLTREEAQKKCEEEGGYLACINSEEEQELIKELLQDPQMHSYWLGGYKKDGSWYWEDKSAFTYKNWDTSAEEGIGSDNYMAMVGIAREGTGKALGEWMDTYNEGYGNDYGAYYNVMYFGYICEWDE